MRFSALILAGGHSRRMGRDKALLPVRGFPSLLARQLELVRRIGPAERIVSCRRGQLLPVPAGVAVVRDDGAAGPLGGLVAGLRAARSECVLVLAVDLAWMTPWLLRRLVAEASADCGIVPRVAGCWQPLAAVWPRRLLPLAEAHQARPEDRALRTLVEAARTAGLLRTGSVTAGDHPAFANCNRPQDYRRLGAG